MRYGMQTGNFFPHSANSMNFKFIDFQMRSYIVERQWWLRLNLFEDGEADSNLVEIKKGTFSPKNTFFIVDRHKPAS